MVTISKNDHSGRWLAVRASPWANRAGRFLPSFRVTLCACCSKLRCALKQVLPNRSQTANQQLFNRWFSHIASFCPLPTAALKQPPAHRISTIPHSFCKLLTFCAKTAATFRCWLVAYSFREHCGKVFFRAAFGLQPRLLASALYRLPDESNVNQPVAQMQKNGAYVLHQPFTRVFHNC